MATVIVAGTDFDGRFAVIDFSNPASPTQSLVTPAFTGGCTVDCSGTLAAAGNYNGGEVAIFDISNPASPAALGIVDTQFGGIGAVSFDGSNVLVGEVNGQRVALISVTNPSAPTIRSTFTTLLASIATVALKGTLAVVASVNDFFFVVLDYSNPANPAQVQFMPGTSGVFFGNTITCDLDGTSAALGDVSTGNIYLFDVAGGSPNYLGQYDSLQQGITSISISGNLVAATSTNDATITLVNFQDPANPSAADTPNSFGGGAVIKFAGSTLAAGSVTGASGDIALFSVAGTSATLLGTDNTTLNSIATVGYTSFTPVTPKPQLTVMPTSLAFGAQRVNTASAAKTVTLKNTGNAPLTFSALNSSIPQFVPSPSGPPQALPAGQSATIHITFTPTAVQTYSANLNISSNDPAHPTVSVPLSGSGGYPHIVVPGPLNFGNVAVCLSHTLNATVGNTGTVDLHVSAIATTGGGFSDTITSLTVAAGGNGNIPVIFKPASSTPLSGTLNFLSDDPNTPNISVALSGVGTPEPPPAIAVSPSAINFGAAPLQYFIGIAVTVSNTGPCEDLDVTLTVTGAAFLLTTGDPTALPTTNPPISDTIAASASKNYTVVFAPTQTGSATGVLTITSNDPAHPSVAVPLSGTGVTVSPAAIELILDRSGSMATAVTGGTRMTALQSAVSMFAELIVTGTGFAMGSTQFDTTEAVLTPLANLDTTQQAAIISGANSLTPRNLTSIGGGLQLGQTSLAPSAIPRKVAIVFTDGYENTPPMIATVEPGVIAAGTEVYAVGLGDPAYLSTAALNSLAASSGGKFFQTIDPLTLRKQFVEVLADAFRQNLAADPIFNLQQGVPMTVPVSITSCESRLSFVLLWEDPTAQIQFTVRAPDGTTFGANSGANNRLIRYIQRPGYRFFQITLPPGPSRTIGPNQLGQWQMLIDPVFISGGTTRASTTVLVEGELRMTADIQASIVGAPMSISVELTHAGALVRNANVKAKLTAPINSLSQLSTPVVRHRAVAADTIHIPPALQVLTHTHTTAYHARFDERTYTIQLPPPAIDGVYNAEVTATGNACGGAFERYWSASCYVGRRPR